MSKFSTFRYGLATPDNQVEVEDGLSGIVDI
jgi:hypothetical protein